MLSTCSDCQKQCWGKKCRECYEKNNNKPKKANPFNLHDIVSPLDITNVDLNSTVNSDRKLFSNPSFNDNGLLSDIEYIVTAEEDMLHSDIDSHTDVNSTLAERFSLVKLVTSLVKRELAPLLKELKETKSANKVLEEEIKALKAERDLAVQIEGSTSPNLDSVLAPYKEALEKLTPMQESLENHQRYLDLDDAKKRERNVIITGVKEMPLVSPQAREEETNEEAGHVETEEAEESENADMAAVKDILCAAGCAVTPLQVKRLGKRSEDESRNRPILVVTDSVDTRKSILKKKSTLKNLADQRYKTIYIKPDEPLAVRKEWKRLRDLMKKEKEAPFNQGVEIKIDFKTRKLLRDGNVIDQFKSPFPKRGPNL